MTAPLTDADLAAIEAEASALPGETWGVAGTSSPMLVTNPRPITDDPEDGVDYGLRLATFPIGYITDDPAVRSFIAASRTRVPALVAELRRLRGLLRDYAVACDVIDATLGIEAPETWEAAQAAHEAARDALYTEGKR